ncbi:MAG: prepilin-type N-terminal cleavage/methylation domain-containing protein [Oceanicaulis sp.]
MTREAGFTLTETLVAVALLALIAASATPAIRGAAHAHARLTEAAGRAAAHLAAEQTLRDLLAAAVRFDAVSEAAFTGGAGGVSFLARPGGGAPVRVQITAQSDGLSLSVAPWPAGAAAVEVFEGGFDQVRMHYFGDPDGGSDLRWRTDWTGPAPPRLLVVDMAPAPDGAVRRMEIAVGGQADFECEYDSGLQACRGGI